MPDRLRFIAAGACAAVVFGLGCLGSSPNVERERVNTNTSSEAHPNPADFSVEELQILQRRFGVHGPQTPLAQLFTDGVDQFQPLRLRTLDRLQALKPAILRESARHRVNPMLVTSILFDEIQHCKPGEELPFIAHSGLLKTHGPAQLGISELIHQNKLPEKPNSPNSSQPCMKTASYGQPWPRTSPIRKMACHKTCAPGFSGWRNSPITKPAAS